MFSVSFGFDLPEVLKSHNLEDNGKVQQVIDSEVLRLNADYVPFDTGALRDSGTAHTEIGSGVVQYQTVYARRQYYIPMTHGNGGNRTDYWFEHMKQDGGKEKILAAAGKAMK